MDTLGSLIDKLCTIDLKMWNAQEQLYIIRHMTYQDFKDYCLIPKDDNLLKIFEIFKKSCDLNYQRNQLIDEIDQLIIRIVEGACSGECLDKYIQRKHKTY